MILIFIPLKIEQTKQSPSTNGYQTTMKKKLINENVGIRVFAAMVLATTLCLLVIGCQTAQRDAKVERKQLRIPRVSKPWIEALRLVGDGKTLYSDFTLIKDKLDRWHCIGTFGKGSDSVGNGMAPSDGYTLFHAVGKSLEVPLAHLEKIPYQIESPQAYMWAPGAIWNREHTTAFLFYFHYLGGKSPEAVCARLLTSKDSDLASWRPYSGTELSEQNMVFREVDDRDFCVFWDDRLGTYLMYYCSGESAGPRVRTSKDLLHWSEPAAVLKASSTDPHVYCESPFVLYRDGCYYASIAESVGEF